MDWKEFNCIGRLERIMIYGKRIMREVLLGSPWFFAKWIPGSPRFWFPCSLSLDDLWEINACRWMERMMLK